MNPLSKINKMVETDRFTIIPDCFGYILISLIDT